MTIQNNLSERLEKLGDEFLAGLVGKTTQEFGGVQNRKDVARLVEYLQEELSHWERDLETLYALDNARDEAYKLELYADRHPLEEDEWYQKKLKQVSDIESADKYFRFDDIDEDWSEVY